MWLPGPAWLCEHQGRCCAECRFGNIPTLEWVRTSPCCLSQDAVIEGGSPNLTCLNLQSQACGLTHVHGQIGHSKQKCYLRLIAYVVCSGAPVCQPAAARLSIFTFTNSLFVIGSGLTRTFAARARTAACNEQYERGWKCMLLGHRVMHRGVHRVCCVLFQNQQQETSICVSCSVYCHCV